MEINYRSQLVGLIMISLGVFLKLLQDDREGRNRQKDQITRRMHTINGTAVSQDTIMLTNIDHKQ